jgi:bifunctional DNA-binding transcriptional regulator/antitoxin component of YhaV-PrlF toxin-antitoxin module
MATVLTRDQATIKPDGSISLPQRIRESGALKVGDTLSLWWLPPDEIILRKVPPGTERDDAEFATAMDGFRDSLAAAGYDTPEKINKLVREAKQEQAQEWILRPPSE